MSSNPHCPKTITQASLAIMVSSLGLVATANAALWGRDIQLNAVAVDNAAAVYLYDDTLNVTWLRDANGNAANGTGGFMNWATANNWAQNLVTGSGATAISDWRLPSTDSSALTRIQAGGVYNTFNMPVSTSEMASLFFGTLGNLSSMAPDGHALDANVYGLQNTGSFLNFKNDLYWSGTQYGAGADYTYSWFFQMKYGAQDMELVRQPNTSYWAEPMAYALAVRSGDVMAAVPEPGTFAMALAGLGLLACVRPRRRA